MRGVPWVVLPTYNEAENLEPMLAAVGAVMQSATSSRFAVLVVDDDSPDGTGEIAERLASERDWVEVLHRDRKEGIGPAYIGGFRHALAAGADYVIEMDCDFSHDPADLPPLLYASARDTQGA